MKPNISFAPAPRRLGASLFACLALGSLASAQLDATILTVSQGAYQSGESAALTLEAEPFNLPIMIMGASQGETVIPGIGTFGVAIEPATRIFTLPRLPASGKKTYTCEFECDSGLRDNPYYIEILTIDLAQGTFAGLSNTVAFQQVDGDCGACIDESETDSYAVYGGGHALTLPGIGKDFIFSPGGSFVERSDGTARMSGVVTRSSDASQSFAVDVELVDRIDPLSILHPPAGSPKLELSDSAYDENGGPVDPRDWRYYESFSGILTGLDDLEGAIVQLDRRGPAFQVGPGANGKNINWGGSGWLDYQTLSQPVNSSALPEEGKGDFNIDAHGDCIDCTDEAKSHAVWLPGLGTRFKFISGGEFEQFVDGTARIVGVIENKDDSANQWSVDIQIDGRINPGSLAYPPVGSPKEELSSGSYSDNGGIIDPATWHYYEEIEGTMTGLLDNQGDMVVLTRRGPAMQVGLGANGKNENYGMSVWLDIALFQGGSQSSVDSVGDINIDLGGECDEDL